MKPLVSVIVPSFNQGNFIKETLDSILHQDYRPIEVLVLDGGSTDQTVNVLKSYNATPELRWWSEPDDGVVDAVNKGLAKTAGEILAIQSSDDVYLPGAISAAVAALTKHPEAAIVYGDVEYIDQNSQPVGKDNLSPFDLKDYLGRFTYIPQPTAFFRGSMAREIGGWRQEVSYTPDADYWLRLAFRHPVVKIDRVMARYRYHLAQRDTQRSSIARDWERMVRDLLATNVVSKELQRFARMGIYLAKYRYTPESDWLMRTRHLYGAAIANPKALFNPHFPKRELLVGREPIWKFFSRVKRLIGFSPRTSSRTERYSAKQKIGALIYDFPRYARLMWIPGKRKKSAPWVFIHNRNEHLTLDPGKVAARCEWKWTSDLHIAKVFPRLGLELMRRALKDSPVVFTAALDHQVAQPDVTFIVGHRGQERMPQLLATLRTISAQHNALIECIVVEQSVEPQIKEALPDWVRYVHAPSSSSDAPYCRSLAFNQGATMAHGSVLVLHDNDLLIPQSYASEIMKRFREGYEVINLKRFIFYLSKSLSQRVCVSGELKPGEAPEAVMQNAQGGGSLAISRQAYISIGGFDESFVGWGGEDNEFWERAQTLRVWPYGYMPIVHLWHEAQAEKSDQERATAELYVMRSSIPAEKRIEELKVRNFQANLSAVRS